MTQPDIWAVCKPFGMLSQFSDSSGRPTLADLSYRFPTTHYPIGRLDMDSEGLLLIASQRSFVHRLLHPDYAHEREYLAQVEGTPEPASLDPIRTGLTLSDWKTKPAFAEPVSPPDWLWPRQPPVRFRKTVPDSWIRLVLTEGKNRQVRRMTAAVGFPTLRLIRIRIGPVLLGSLKPGDCRRLTSTEMAFFLS